MNLNVKRIGEHSLPLPKYETAGASGFDLRAVTFQGMTYLLVPGERVSMPCGFAFEVPEGYELQVRPRSGLSSKAVVATFGTVDADYRGEVRILLMNMSGEPFTVNNGDRIAQGVIAPVLRVEVEEAAELTPTERGGNGFGSTGTK